MIYIRSKLTLSAIALLLLSGFSLNKADAGLILPADFAIVGYDSGANDFSLLALDDIAAGTTFFLTDQGWSNAADGFATSAFDNTRTWTTGSLISAGTILHNSVGLGGTISGSAISLSTMGDSLMIFQTADDVATSNPKHFVYGFNANFSTADTVGGWQTAATVASTASNLPTTSNAVGVTEVTAQGGPGNFFGLLGDDSSVAASDQYAYTGDTSSADKDTWLSRLHNTGNWTTSTGGGVVLTDDVAGGATQVPVEDPPAVIPEPASLAIFGFGALSVLCMGRRRRKEKQAA